VTSRYLIELDGEPAMVVRVLKLLLKYLGRQHNVKCRAIEPVADEVA
jgi:hypothetical protein